MDLDCNEVNRVGWASVALPTLPADAAAKFTDSLRGREFSFEAHDLSS